MSLAWRIGVAVALLASLWMAPRAEANVLCRILPMPCTYEGAAFQFTVVDAETRQPLPDVHALAEWQLYGTYGRNGPLMVQDALSGVDGVLAFPPWGPVHGPRSGLILNSDPVVTLMKPGYETLRLFNAFPAETDERTRQRRFGREGETLALKPFQGTPEQWVEQLRGVWHGLAFPRSEEDSRQFREPYLNRLRRVWAEREKLPDRHRAIADFFSSVEAELRSLEEGRR
jgi:hypothetical protein